MHYANCNTYNADFDGDEINLHCPQDYCARVEALNIMDADKQSARERPRKDAQKTAHVQGEACGSLKPRRGQVHWFVAKRNPLRC